MVPEPLQVDPERLRSAGVNLDNLAYEIPRIEPVAAAALSPGSDPLSAAIAAKIPELERRITG